MIADLVIDLQFGSTGKGLLSSYLAETQPYTAAVTANGPNAGHTSYVGNDKVVRCALPNSPCHSPLIRDIFIAPGAVISAERVIAELKDTRRYNPYVQLYIHQHAAVVTARHAEAEAHLNRIGSTQKGTSEAVIEKIRRNLEVTAGFCDALAPHVLQADEWEKRLYEHGRVLVEGSQGFSLGLNSGFYPYCTSRECTASSLMSDCLIPRRSVGKVYGTARTYPIRVANRFDGNGVMVGWSGPHYRDQVETTFEAIGQPVEYTTVTQLPRRVFTFSHEQVRRAVARNGVDEIFLSFCDYLEAGSVHDFADRVESEAGAPVTLLAYGPRVSDVATRATR